jgi:hypothetical protein
MKCFNIKRLNAVKVKTVSLKSGTGLQLRISGDRRYINGAWGKERERITEAQLKRV